jgi:hypothetical protein
MKKKIVVSVVLITAIALLVFLLFHLRQDDPINPNLMMAPKEFIYPAHAEAKLKRFLEHNGLEKICIKETVNTRYPREKWSGRLKYSAISYQALFAPGHSKIIFKLKKLTAPGLTFSIFNPKNSRMFYKVAVKYENQAVTLYRGFYDKETLVSETIDLKRRFNREVELVFETRGKGIGAWINPRLTVREKKPKVFIVIVLDTVRYDHTSLYGYSRKTTPTLDRVSRDAVVFQNAYTTTSWTLPAHVSLFSGKNLDDHGVITPNDRISDRYPLVSEIFQEKGYVTAAFTGGGFIEDTYGFARGFQLYSNIPGRVFSMNSSERVFNHFKKYIERFWGNDLFIFLHTYQAHAPYKAPHEYIDQINTDVRANLKGIKNFIRDNREYYKAIDPVHRQMLIDLYDASILYADKMLVGSVVDFLKEKEIYDDAMLVVLSDHGEEFYDHHSWEHGHTLYNELIKIPLLVKYPKNRLKGREETLVSIADIPSMILKESGLPFEKKDFKDGMGQEKREIPVLLPISPIIKQFPPKISFVDKDHHFIFNIFDKKKQSFFNPLPPGVEEMELYDTKDYREKTNLYRNRKGIVDRFGKRLGKYLKRIKSVKMKKFKLNKELEEKLKSLGYLGN